MRKLLRVDRIRSRYLDNVGDTVVSLVSIQTRTQEAINGARYSIAEEYQYFLAAHCEHREPAHELVAHVDAERSRAAALSRLAARSEAPLR